MPARNWGTVEKIQQKLKESVSFEGSSSAVNIPYIKNRVIKISRSSLSIWNEVILLVYRGYRVQLLCGVSNPYGAVREQTFLQPSQSDKLITKDRKRYKFWNIIVQLVQMEYNYIISLPTPIVYLGGWRNRPQNGPLWNTKGKEVDL